MLSSKDALRDSKIQDPLLKKERIQKLTETADSLYTYQNKRDKTSFQHDMWYFKDLPGRIAFDKLLCNKAFNIARKPKYDRYQPKWSCFSGL